MQSTGATQVMSRLRQWPWAVASLFLVAAAAAAAGSTYLFWLPCRGNMSTGLKFMPDAPGSRISEACLLQMDAGTPFPFPSDGARVTDWGSGLSAIAMALTGLAWLVLVLGMPWRIRTRAVALLPAVLSIGLALASGQAIIFSGPNESAYPSLAWWVVLDVTAMAALVVLRTWQPEIDGWQCVRLVLVLWGVTAFSWSHVAVDFLAMVSINSYDWDCPPGCGYPTAVAIAVAAGLASHAAKTMGPDAAG